jgi:hypothetical protein
VKTTGLVIALLRVLAWLPSSVSAAVYADVPNQAAAQVAAPTVDADGDCIYCESLPCPCSTGSGAQPRSLPPLAHTQPVPRPPMSPTFSGTNRGGCERPKSVQRLVLSKLKYPNIRAHVLAAVAEGWPRIMVVNRVSKELRRARLLTFSWPGSG